MGNPVIVCDRTSRERRMNRVAFALVAAFVVFALGRGRTPSSDAVPTVWDDAAMREVELPLAAHIPVHHMPAEFYYRIPTRPNLKTYPIYTPGREPAGYWTW